MERAALDQLVDYFERRLAGYPTTLSEDESLVIITYLKFCGVLNFSVKLAEL